MTGETRAQSVHADQAARVQAALAARGLLPDPQSMHAGTGPADVDQAPDDAQSVHAEHRGTRTGTPTVYRLSARAALVLADVLARPAAYGRPGATWHGWHAPAGSPTAPHYEPGAPSGPWRPLDRSARPELAAARRLLLPVDVVLDVDRPEKLAGARIAGEELAPRPAADADPYRPGPWHVPADVLAAAGRTAEELAEELDRAPRPFDACPEGCRGGMCRAGCYDRARQLAEEADRIRRDVAALTRHLPAWDRPTGPTRDAHPVHVDQDDAQRFALAEAPCAACTQAAGCGSGGCNLPRRTLQTMPADVAAGDAPRLADLVARALGGRFAAGMDPAVVGRTWSDAMGAPEAPRDIERRTRPTWPGWSDPLSGPRTAAGPVPGPLTPGKARQARTADDGPRLLAFHPYRQTVDQERADGRASGARFAAGAFRAPQDVDQLADRVREAGTWTVPRYAHLDRIAADLPDVGPLPVLRSFVDLAGPEPRTVRGGARYPTRARSPFPPDASELHPAGEAPETDQDGPRIRPLAVDCPTCWAWPRYGCQDDQGEDVPAHPARRALAAGEAPQDGPAVPGCPTADPDGRPCTFCHADAVDRARETAGDRASAQVSPPITPQDRPDAHPVDAPTSDPAQEAPPVDVTEHHAPGCPGGHPLGTVCHRTPERIARERADTPQETPQDVDQDPAGPDTPGTAREAPHEAPRRPAHRDDCNRRPWMDAWAPRDGDDAHLSTRGPACTCRLAPQEAPSGPRVGDPVPGTRASFYGALDPAVRRSLTDPRAQLDRPTPSGWPTTPETPTGPADPWGPDLDRVPPGWRVHWRRAVPFTAPPGTPVPEPGGPLSPNWHRVAPAAVEGWHGTRDSGPAPWQHPADRDVLQAAQDGPQDDVVGMIRAQTRAAILDEIDRQILGTGPGEPLTGILAGPGPQEAPAEAPQEAPAARVTVTGRDALRVTYRPPSDAQKARDAAARAAQDAPQDVAGIPVGTSPFVPPGTALLGAFTTGPEHPCPAAGGLPCTLVPGTPGCCADVDVLDDAQDDQDRPELHGDPPQERPQEARRSPACHPDTCRRPDRPCTGPCGAVPPTLAAGGLVTLAAGSITTGILTTTLRIGTGRVWIAPHPGPLDLDPPAPGTPGNPWTQIGTADGTALQFPADEAPEPCPMAPYADEPATWGPLSPLRAVTVSFDLVEPLNPATLRLLLGARPSDLRARHTRARVARAMRALRRRAARIRQARRETW